jgi:HTH-type transcriptional regulator/antitoxin MqsA
MEKFTDETMAIEYKGRNAKVSGLSGWRCGAEGEVIFDPSSAKRYADAGDELVMQDRRREGREIKRIRMKLNLSQKLASALTGGGHNAFSRYEQGLVKPLPAVRNLFYLLDENPRLLEKLGIEPDLGRKSGGVRFAKACAKVGLSPKKPQWRLAAEVAKQSRRSAKNKMKATARAHS